VIPLGILAAAGAGAVAAVGSYDLLATEILTTSQSSVTFSSLGDYAADYQHLQVRMAIRGAGAYGSLRAQVTFNSNTTGYSSHGLIGTGSSVVSEAYTSEAFGRLGRVIGNSGTSNSFAGLVTDVLDPFESTKNTTIRTLNGNTGYNQIQLYSTLWNNTAAVTSMAITPEAGNWIAGSRFSLYGIRKAA
jgi:hypothetical protein